MCDDDNGVIDIAIKASNDGGHKAHSDKTVDPRLHRLTRLRLDPVNRCRCSLDGLSSGAVPLPLIGAKVLLPQLGELQDYRRASNTSDTGLCLGHSLGSLDSSLEVGGEYVVDWTNDRGAGGQVGAETASLEDTVVCQGRVTRACTAHSLSVWASLENKRRERGRDTLEASDVVDRLAVANEEETHCQRR